MFEIELLDELNIPEDDPIIIKENTVLYSDGTYDFIIKEENIKDKNGLITDSYYYILFNIVFHLKFDMNGRKISQCYYNYDRNEKEIPFPKNKHGIIEFYYDENDNNIQQKKCYENGEYTLINFKYLNNELVQKEEIDSSTKSLNKRTKYSNGLITQLTIFYSRTNDILGEIFYEYDIHKNLINEKKIDSEGNIKELYTAKFNKKNKIIEENQIVNDKFSYRENYKKDYKYDKNNTLREVYKYDEIGSYTKSLYNKNAQIIEKLNYTSKGQINIKTEYNNPDFHKKKSFYNQDTILSSKTYDHSDEIIEIKSFNLDGTLSKRFTYNRNISSQIFQKFEFNAENIKVRKTEFTEKISEGVLTKTIKNYLLNTIYEVDYDLKGNVIEERIM